MLCERRIGDELKQIPRSHGGPPRKVASEARTPPPPTIQELGFKRQRAAEYIALTEIAPEAIKQAAQEATGAGKPLTKADVMLNRAGGRPIDRSRLAGA